MILQIPSHPLLVYSLRVLEFLQALRSWRLAFFWRVEGFSKPFVCGSVELEAFTRRLHGLCRIWRWLYKDAARVLGLSRVFARLCEAWSRGF